MFGRIDLYHRCLDPIIAEINVLCTEDKYYRFADNKVRKGRCFFHLLCSAWMEQRLLQPPCAALKNVLLVNAPGMIWRV